MVDEAKDQMTSYLLHRESQSGGDDSQALARGLDRKLDALYGKIDQLASAGPRGGGIRQAPAVSRPAAV